MSAASQKPVNHFDFFWSLGYTRLVPIIPPNAPISPKSNLFKRLEAGDDARGKAPGIRWPDGTWSGYDWVKAEDVEITKWSDMGAGVGIKTGRGLVAIDADTENEERARIIKEAIERTFGVKLPVRIGKYPKAIYLVRTDVDFIYTRIEFGERDAKGRLRERVEILSEGRQFVAHGVHPATGKPYRWPQGIPPLADVPFVDGARLMALLEELRPLLPAASEIVREGAGADTEVDQDSLRGDWAMVEKAVRATPNTSSAFPTREAYRDYGYAIKAAAGPEREADALALYLDWCARWQDGDNDPEIAAADWHRMKPPFRRGASWLYELAEQHGSGFTADEAVAGKWFDETAAKAAPAGEKLPDAFEKVAAGIKATPFSFPDPAALPRRQWLYGGHYIRKFVSATVAPSGVGKSSLEIVEALCMASGKPLLGVQPKGQFRVWMWNGEDPRDELERRIAAAMLHYGLTREDIEDRLFVDTGRETEIILATEARDGAKIAQPVVSAVIETIMKNRIDVFQADPFVSSHRVSENDNGAIDMVSKQWARIADVTNTAIELVHHVRKLNGAEITVEDSRGAVALIATSRSARALTKMSKAEASRLGLDDFYQRLFRFGDGKNNLALPATDETAWMELRSVQLGNGEGEPVERMLTGDSVGVVTAYRLERGAPAVAKDEKAAAIAMVKNGEWRRDIRAGDAWIGVPIAQAMNLDLDEPSDKAKVRQVVSEWIKAGALREVSRKDAQRRLRTYVEAVAADNMSENEEVSAFD